MDYPRPSMKINPHFNSCSIKQRKAPLSAKAFMAFILFFMGGISADSAYAQTTFYLTTGATNPQSASITYYDATTTAGSLSNGLYTQPNTTVLDYAAEGAAG